MIIEAFVGPMWISLHPMWCLAYLLLTYAMIALSVWWLYRQDPYPWFWEDWAFAYSIAGLVAVLIGPLVIVVAAVMVGIDHIERKC